MNSRGLCLVCLLLFAGVLGAAADVPRAETTDPDRLVQRLGSPRFAEREAAFKALDALGATALPALRAAAKSTDAEVRQRAGELLAKLERAADAAEAFAPTKVRLKAADAPLADVVRDLTLQSRVRLQLAREPVDLPARRVTVDTGELSFWEALEALCRQAKVSIRPGVFEPTGGEAPIGRALNFFSAPTHSTQRTEEPLVLQDGELPTCPTAHFGAVRLRLVPDRWGNRTREPGQEQQWALEVYSEPRVNWQGPPAVTFEKAAGLTVTCASVTSVSAYRGVMFGASAIGTDGRAPPRGVSQYQLPVTLKADPQPGRNMVPELRGTLATTVQLGTQLTVTVDEVDKPNAKGADPHGTKVTVGNCQVNPDGTVTIQTDVERPNAGAMGGGSFRTGGTGIPLASAAPMLTSLGRDHEALRLVDTQDRPYVVTLKVSGATQQGQTTVVNYVVEAKPPAPDAKPKKLELHCPRRAPVEAKFTLRDVPVP